MISEAEVHRFKKEKVKLDYIKRERINELLLIHPHSRTSDHECELAELLIDYPCFQYVAEESFSKLIELTKEIYMECLLPDSIIFNQGDEADCAYLIIQGHASVFVTFTYQKFQKVKTKTKQMCDMGNRTLFGELSLLFKGKRTATVKSQEATHVIIIPSHTFNAYMRVPMLQRLSVIMQFYRSLSFMDHIDSNTLMILASKTNIQNLQTHTLVARQGNKCKNLYFIRKGRVKVLRNVEMIDHSGREITIENYKLLFQDPELQHRKRGLVISKQLELTELGQYECFGEDWETAANFLLNTQDKASRPISYSVITILPLECYCIKKKDFYEYINDTTKKQALKYFRQYPRDRDLRRFYYEQHNWQTYRQHYAKDNIMTPRQILKDRKRMHEINIEDDQIKKKKSEIILPKINKKAQNKQRIMGWNPHKASSQLEKIGFKSRNKSLEHLSGTYDPVSMLGRMAELQSLDRNQTLIL